MTHQTVDELHEDAKRLNQSVIEAMREWQDDHPDTPWRVEYEIPAETNGWVYYGDCGAAATMANWGNQYPNPTEAVCVIVHPTHPHDEVEDWAEVTHVPDLSNKLENKTQIDTVRGEPYRTPLYVRRRMFWQAVESAITWMNNNPPGE